MSDEMIQVYLDLLPNQPKNEQTREANRQMMRQRFERKLPEAVERIWELPPIILKEPSGIYVELLSESRELFIAGHFYSCVAMCGIVGERLIKDLFRASILIQRKGSSPDHPADAAFDQLERIEVSGIINFLKEAALLKAEAAKAAQKLSELRNQYAHARGKDFHKDAIKAINLLDTVVEGTVSVFKDFEIKKGTFVCKPAAQVHKQD